MGFLHAAPKLQPGETVRWKALANHVAGPSYVLYGATSSASGRLYVTDRRIFFQPGRADTMTGQKLWECPLASIEGFEEMERDPNGVFTGGMRHRLGIRSAAGVEAFVVSDLHAKLIELRALLGR